MRVLLTIPAFAATIAAFAAELVALDPFARATAGFAACADVQPRLYGPDEVGAHAHARAERGTRCAMEGTCEPGGAYKRDPEINERVRAAIAADARFADTSVWVTTSRRWITLEGCVRSAAQRKALVDWVTSLPNVERVFDSLRVGARDGPR
jgi:hypothetical protein